MRCFSVWNPLTSPISMTSVAPNTSASPTCHRRSAWLNRDWPKKFHLLGCADFASQLASGKDHFGNLGSSFPRLRAKLAILSQTQNKRTGVGQLPADRAKCRGSFVRTRPGPCDADRSYRRRYCCPASFSCERHLNNKVVTIGAHWMLHEVDPIREMYVGVTAEVGARCSLRVSRSIDLSTQSRISTASRTRWWSCQKPYRLAYRRW